MESSMQEKVRSWFRRSQATTTNNAEQQEEPTSLLADWKSYISIPSTTFSSSRPETSSVSGSGTAPATEQSGLDLESSFPESWTPLFRSASDTLVGTFSIVSKGVRDIPGNVQSAASSFPSGKALMYFGLLMATGIFFIFMALLLFLPVIVLLPQKFAISFTLGCLLIVLSFFALKGPKTQFLHMVSKERLPFTIGFVASMVVTIYVSMVLHSYLLSVIFSGVQVLALVYYVISYFPGGSTGMKFLTSKITSSIMKCFG